MMTEKTRLNKWAAIKKLAANKEGKTITEFRADLQKVLDLYDHEDRQMYKSIISKFKAPKVEEVEYCPNCGDSTEPAINGDMSELEYFGGSCAGCNPNKK